MGKWKLSKKCTCPCEHKGPAVLRPARERDKPLESQANGPAAKAAEKDTSTRRSSEILAELAVS